MTKSAITDGLSAVEKNLSITVDCSVSSDSDSGVESAMSSPTTITNQSPSKNFELVPRESVASDLASDDGAKV